MQNKNQPQHSRRPVHYMCNGGSRAQSAHGRCAARYVWIGLNASMQKTNEGAFNLISCPLHHKQEFQELRYQLRTFGLAGVCLWNGMAP
jgi:hypothetical protein